jgi:SAM-dependent methyltransferase
MPRVRFYISSFFLSKFYLLKDIKKVLNKYDFSGSLLDVGCGEKPYKNLFKNTSEYKGVDFKNYSINKDFRVEKPDYYFDDDYLRTLKLPFQDNSFDHCVSFQVLEHHINPQKMISEIFRITKPGGFILITVPFLGGIHEEPYDYQRFTKYGLIELFKKYKCEILEIKNQGSLFSTISLLLNEYLNDFASRSKFTYFLSVLIYLPFILFQYISLVLDKIFKSNNIFFNYLVLIRKNG